MVLAGEQFPLQALNRGIEGPIPLPHHPQRRLSCRTGLGHGAIVGHKGKQQQGAIPQHHRPGLEMQPPSAVRQGQGTADHRLPIRPHHQEQGPGLTLQLGAKQGRGRRRDLSFRNAAIGADIPDHLEELVMLIENQGGPREGSHQGLQQGQVLLGHRLRQQGGAHRLTPRGRKPEDQRAGARRAGRLRFFWDAPIEVLGRIHRREARSVRAEALGASQQQQPAGLEGEAEQIQHPGVQGRLEVDEGVAAGNQIQVGEGGVFAHVVPGKHHAAAQPLGHRDALGPLGHETVAQLRRNGHGGGERILTPTGDRQTLFIQVGGEDAQPAGQIGGMAEHLAHHHGDGVGLLAGGTAGHPHPQRFPITALGKILLQPLRQPLEGGRIAKKASHRHQQVAHQGGRL